MNIALVHDWLTNIAGGERVLYEMSKIFPDAPIYTTVFDPEQASIFADKKIITSFLQKYPLIRKKREFLVPLSPFAMEQFDFSKYDVVISDTTMAGKGIITKPDTLNICYCHTPPRYLWEPEVDPRAKAGFLSGFRKRTAHNLRIWDRAAADRVDYFIANSNYVKKRIKKYYQRDAVTIYPPVDISRFKVAPKEDIKDYFLFVSRLVSYKKCDLVVEAFNDLKLPLKIIGRGPEKSNLQKIANENIEFLGYLSDEEIAKYYAEAAGFVFAAEEDFGIVPVEAMASGRPVIAYRAGGALETIIEGVTGEFFDEQTPQCIADAVKNFDPYKYDPQKIQNQAKKYSIEVFSKKFKEFINHCIEDKK